MDLSTRHHCDRSWAAVLVHFADIEEEFFNNKIEQKCYNKNPLTRKETNVCPF
jgi:hypothetical protein